MHHEPSYYPMDGDQPQARVFVEGRFAPCLWLGSETDPRLVFGDPHLAIEYLTKLAGEAMSLAEALRDRG